MTDLDPASKYPHEVVIAHLNAPAPLWLVLVEIIVFVVVNTGLILFIYFVNLYMFHYGLEHILYEDTIVLLLNLAMVLNLLVGMAGFTTVIQELVELLPIREVDNNV